MPERPKGYDWKSYVQKCTEGSNPSLSASKTLEALGRDSKAFKRRAFSRTRRPYEDYRGLLRPFGMDSYSMVSTVRGLC